jgi:hypothetical protein
VRVGPRDGRIPDMGREKATTTPVVGRHEREDQPLELILGHGQLGELISGDRDDADRGGPDARESETSMTYWLEKAEAEVTNLAR